MRKILAYLVGFIGMLFGVVALLFRTRDDHNDGGGVQRDIERNRSINSRLDEITRATGHTQDTLERARGLLAKIKERNGIDEKKP